MDIIDAKPMCGWVRSDNPDRACTLPAGHAGVHHWRPYPNASSGSVWHASLAVSPDAARDAKPTADEIEEIREDMAEMASRKEPRLASSSGWQQEQDRVVIDKLTKEVAQAKADSAKFYQAWQAEIDGRLTAEAERDRYKARWELCEATAQKQDEALEAAGLAMDQLVKERDLARSELDLCTGRLQTAVGEVTAIRGKLDATSLDLAQVRRDAALLRTLLDATEAELAQARQAADAWAATAREYELLFGIWRPDSGPDVRAEDVVSQPPMPCPHSKAKQFGPATYVMRRCKLVDGHDGMCEPA